MLLNQLLKADCIDNGHYSWLMSPKNVPMQLDRFYPGLNLAVEVNGRQHYKYTPTLHKDYSAFEYLRECDKLKEELCKEKGVTLIRIRYDAKLSPEYITHRLQQAGVQIGKEDGHACQE